jgi:hypothetical protein
VAAEGENGRVPLGRESIVVALASLAIALAALRFSISWSRGVIGHGDAWQNLWNLDHVGRWLGGNEPLFFTQRLWAPEGASLIAHTLSLTNMLPGAFLSRFAGTFATYNLLVLFSYVLAAVALYRLARRMGANPWGAALGALVFAFNPQRSARALGHLNLLGTGWIALSLEALWVATRRETRRPLLAAAGAGLALGALAWCDWYLALCGAIAAACFVLFEAVRGDRGRTLTAAAAAAAISFAAAGPYALALARESAQAGTEGHESRWSSTAVTSLVIPARIQLVSRVTRPLTERNHQNIAESAGYLGLVPLGAALWLVAGRRRERALDFAAIAGGIGVVLALGPQLRVFDRLLDVPLPYALLERLFPALRVGGCSNRYVALAFLPLALATAFAATRLLASGRRAFVAVGALLIAIEYAPISPGVSLWPWLPPDPAMEAIASSPASGNVLDLDRTTPALIRQLRHGRPQILGYLSRTPSASEERRLADPVLGPLLEPGHAPAPVPQPLAAALLRDRWNTAFIVADEGSPAAARVARLGFPLFARSDRSVVWRVPADPVAGSAPLTWSRGRDAGVIAPGQPGTWILTLEPRAATRVEVRWGAGREIVRTLETRTALEVPVTAADLSPDGALLVTIASEPFGGGEGAHVVSFEKN